MPPFGFRKRERSASPLPTPPSTNRTATATKGKRPTLFETADAPSKREKTLEENRKLLKDLDADDDDESSLSEADSHEFEDIPAAKRRKTSPIEGAEVDENEDEGEDEMDWEDAIQPGPSSNATPVIKPDQDIGDVSISMNEDGSHIEPLVSAATVKKGPSKRERQIRIQTHCLHVQALMWHNTVRNSWLNDKEVHKTLIDGLTDGVKREVKRWKAAMGTLSKDELESKKQQISAKNRDKKGKKGKQNSGGRDWNYEAEHLEQGVANLSGGDPMLRLMKVLTAYWRKRFAITAPGLRKQGYKPLRRLRDDIKAWESETSDMEEHGERIEDLQAFHKLARKCEGSRDVGAQLFVALLRGLGLETRMVANLQPAGFGWSKAEEADPKKSKKKDEKPEIVMSESEDDEVKIVLSKKTSKGKMKESALEDEKPTRKSSRGNKADPISLDDPESSLSSPPPEADDDVIVDENDDLSVIDVTPSIPKKKSTKKYDRDLSFPNYWTEACSPVLHKYYPVDPTVLSTIASSDELLQTFEPRGKKAEKAKQVMAYAIAFSADGTAKDVTVRYLKRHQLPGKTKGMRMPVEKVPVYNRRGKVKRYEEYDWFRTLMSIYDRPESKRTAADDLEDQTDLKPFKPAKEVREVEKESLQGYKQSAEFVLEQHLRREEAILPGANPVKTFTAGKGDKAKEHPVYRREDVFVCKTVESWHKEGRAIKVGEQPIKYVPMRAVTLIRKREMEDAQRETGEKLKQGLYAEYQTDWIIPPPIENGVIPKNAFGNMDVYVPTMVPKGAVHLPLKGSAKICRKLQIDYAEACTGFEFGKQRAVPVLTGVVVAKENADMVKAAWRADQEELRRKEDTKRTGVALHWWRKMVLGLRVLERMRVEYADASGEGKEVNPFLLKAKREGRHTNVDQLGEEEIGGGGFVPEGYDEEEVPQAKAFVRDEARDETDQQGEDDDAGGFLVEDGDDETTGGSGFLVEYDPDEVAKLPPKNHAPITPVSLQSIHKTMANAADSDDEDEVTIERAVRSSKSSTAPFTNGRGKAQPKMVVAKGAKAKSSRQQTIPSEDEEEDSSSLSDLSDSSHTDSDQASDLDSNTKFTLAPSKKARASSPQVIITPQTATSRLGGRKPRLVKKSTPVRSQYFDHGNDGDDDEDEEAESDGEIIRPRQTTARTRGRL